MSDIAYCAIHPGIGIARVGDSRHEFFVGPERPGRPEPPAGGYKDPGGRIKRQAARFRVFGFAADGTVVRELTDADAEIEWTVHLANRKAAAHRFLPDNPDQPEPRNPGVPPEARDTLVIDPGARTIGGRDVRDRDIGERAHHFDTGTFLGKRVELGELRTDEAGRLLVLGGHGSSGSPGNTPVGHFADNDGWHDDTSDGPVTARVTLRDGGGDGGGKELEVRHGSWVIVAPPDFAPSITNLVTLYDAVEDLLARTAAGDLEQLPPADEVWFERDIRPLLERTSGYQWVNAAGLRGHRGSRGTAENNVTERGADFFEPDLYALLSSPADGDAARRRVFELLRAPLADSQTATTQARPDFMPQLSGDRGRGTVDEPTTWLTVTPLQYARLRKWAAGDFHPGGDAAASAPAVATTPGPDELDRAALEACVGGPFFPGIEMSARWRDELDLATPFRLRADLKPGDMTERMAVPWQADFADCRHFWWPAQRPDDVIVDEEFEAITTGRHPAGGKPPRSVSGAAFPRRSWARGIGDQLPAAVEDEQYARNANLRHHEMVREWPQLGFVVPRTAYDGSEVWVETERDSYTGLRDRDYFHIMLNLGQYPDFLPVARQLAEQFLAAARVKQQGPDLDSDLRYFRYTELAFDTRLDSIYDDLVDAVKAYDPVGHPVFRTREDVIERLRQYAPVNQTDGLWLRNVATVGPIDDLTGYLAEIWIDEVGGGDPAQNHSNVYTATLASVGISPAPVTSEEYALDQSFYDSAFTVPLLELVVSQFTADYFPEILGMTLYLEWESVELATTASLLRLHQIDPTYYTLHLAIDNADAGHGALAKRAVKRYLATFHDEDQKQAQWRRIWDGYVAFRTAGTLADDLVTELAPSDRAERRVLQMIERKRRYGSLNHGHLAPGSGMNNNLFDQPELMLHELVKHGLVVPGDPERSPFLHAFDFGGRMYRVFTSRERRLWEDWIRQAPKDPAARTAVGTPTRTREDTTGDPTAIAAKSWSQDVTPAPPTEPYPHVPHLLLSSRPEDVDVHPRGTLLGQASVH